MQNIWFKAAGLMLLITGALVLSACSSSSVLGAYYVDIPQGNLFTEEQIAEVQPGMTQRQVRFILGSPLVTDTFNSDRWDYLYSVTRRDQVNIEQHLTIYFNEGLVERIEKQEKSDG